MKTVTISTYLDAAPEVVRKHVMTPALLLYVVAGAMRFRPVQPRTFPPIWQPGNYRVSMWALHIIPIGWQNVKIELPGPTDEWWVRDNGSGSLARIWDHRIFIEPEGSGTRYIDQVSVDAGILSWVVWVYAQLFYRYRQRRWRKLVALEFRPLQATDSSVLGD
jgi:hypothetical protein